ncbi:hypothetical protein B0H21DRAFT_765868 [Amylocystis lapponica]|nr:hypothetical protein B0H21DRAFT_765868 [Amylocystis lapponica]
MQNPNSYYAVPRCDSQVWMDWELSDRVNNASSSSSGSASTSTTIVEDFQVQGVNNSQMSICYSLTPPTPNTLSSDVSSSQISIDSESIFNDMPEIPFISSCGDGWADADHHRRAASDNHEYERSTSQSFDRNVAVLGHTNDRVFAPSRSRKRSGSVSSTASSRSKPAPAKSILSSSASIRSRQGRAPPSVKFLEMPTIHYEEEYESEPYRAPAGSAEKKGGFLEWLLRPVRKPAVPERPTISGPFPLWEAPPRQARGAPAYAASLRSVRSNGSLRSVGSCSSRLQTYWSRMTGRDP